jgi:uncharacterized phage protein (TIGR01671 family)
MREIKFNAVDEETGEYIVFNHFVNHNRVHNDEGHETLSRFLEFYYGFRLLQYTGLKDKNGIEIYEGDAIYDELDNTVSLVNFINGAFASETYIDDNEEVEHTDNRCFLAERVTSDYGNRLEVIGNIYENKELLND